MSQAAPQSSRIPPSATKLGDEILQLGRARHVAEIDAGVPLDLGEKNSLTPHISPSLNARAGLGNTRRNSSTSDRLWLQPPPGWFQPVGDAEKLSVHCQVLKRNRH
jgi:hypothetical protein